MIEKKVKVVATRFNCRTGEPRLVEQELVLRESPSFPPGEPWLYAEPGVTGYESVGFEEHREGLESRGWWACAGTPGSWDALFFHALQLKKAFKEFD